MNAVIERYISEFSGSFQVAVLLWPLLSFFLCLPILLYLYRRDGWLRLGTVSVVYLSILYAAGLVCFTLYPLPSGDSGPGITYGIPPIWNPLNFIQDVSHRGMTAVLQLLLNIVLFMPLGFIAKTFLRLKLAPTLAISFVATCLIETAQLTGLFGLYPYAFRTFDVDDLICNTLGGLLGWLAGYAATKLIMRGSTELPPVTHSPGFIRRCVTLWTDFMIIDVCYVVPRIVIAVGLRMLYGESADMAAVPLEQVDEVASLVCFAIAFIFVETTVPWRHDGSTPAGMFYRMSCETKERTGNARKAFYAARSVVLFVLMLFPRYVAIPLALFYLITRKMPYDFIPGSDGRRRT